MENIIEAHSLEEFDALISQYDYEELHQYKILFLTNNQVLVSYSDGYNRFYEDMNILVSNIKSYQYFDISFESEISSAHITVNDLLKTSNSLDTQCIITENTNLKNFLNNWGNYSKVKEYIDCFNQYDRTEKYFLELPIEDIITEKPIQENQLIHSPLENELVQHIDCPIRDYISFQIYCNYVNENISDKDYNLILSHQDELYHIMTSNNNFDYAIYHTLVKNAPYNIDNPYIKDKLLVVDNPIVKIYNGSWHFYEENIIYEDIQAYRVNCIDITGKISIYDISSKNYDTLKDKTNTLINLYNLCKNINGNNLGEETTTIMFSNQPSEKQDRIVFCQKISKLKNTLAWKLLEVNMAGTLSECINYKDYKFEPIVLTNSFIKKFIQKDNIIDNNLISKMTDYKFEFFVLRPTGNNHNISLYNAPITTPLTKDINKNISTLIDYFQSNSNKTIQPNDIIVIKKKSTLEALAYQYIDDNNYKKTSLKKL